MEHKKRYIPNIPAAHMPEIVTLTDFRPQVAKALGGLVVQETQAKPRMPLPGYGA